MRMVDALKAVELYLNLVIVRNRFNIMIKKQLATEEVIHTARRVHRERKERSKNRGAEDHGNQKETDRERTTQSMV